MTSRAIFLVQTCPVPGALFLSFSFLCSQVLRLWFFPNRLHPFFYSLFLSAASAYIFIVRWDAFVPALSPKVAYLALSSRLSAFARRGAFARDSFSVLPLYTFLCVLFISLRVPSTVFTINLPSLTLLS